MIPCAGADAPAGLATATEGFWDRALVMAWRAQKKRGARCADAGPNTCVPKNTPDTSRTSRPLYLAFFRTAPPEGFTIRCLVRPRTFGLVRQLGPKTLPPGEPFRPRGLPDSRAHDPEGSERAIHVPPKRVWLQLQNLPAAQILVDNESGHAQFIHRFSTGPMVPRRSSHRNVVDQADVAEPGGGKQPRPRPSLIERATVERGQGLTIA